MQWHSGELLHTTTINKTGIMVCENDLSIQNKATRLLKKQTSMEVPPADNWLLFKKKNHYSLLNTIIDFVRFRRCLAVSFW